MFCPNSDLKEGELTWQERIVLKTTVEISGNYQVGLGDKFDKF